MNPIRTPAFTIIIPTRNRPDYMSDAVCSVVNQTFSDWELIVSDNSDDHLAVQNRRWVDALNDSRIRYVRPAKILGMADHWEWAAAQARGQYIGILTDRMAFRLFTLERISRTISEKRPAAVCFSSQNLKEFPGYREARAILQSHGEKEITSSERLDRFSLGKIEKNTPRGLNSFVRSDILDAIKSRHGVVFGGVSPDYFLTFTFLDVTESYIYIDEPLLLVQGEAISNGGAFSRGKRTNTTDDFVSRLTPKQIAELDFGPIPGDMSLLTHGILREYEVLRLTSKSARFRPIDPAGFYEESVRYICQLAKSGQLADSTRLTVDTYADQHGLVKRHVPKNRKASLTRTAYQILVGRVHTPVYGSIIRQLRRYINRISTLAGFNRVVVGRDLAEMLRRDCKVSRKHSVRGI